MTIRTYTLLCVVYAVLRLVDLPAKQAPFANGTNELTEEERHVYDLQGTACTFTVDTGSDCVVIGEDENSLIKGIIQINSIPKLILELQQIMDIVDESKKGIVLKKMQA